MRKSLVASVKGALGIVDISGDEFGVLDAAVGEGLVHDLHDGNALAPGHRVALLLTVTETASALIGLPEHTVAPVALGVLGDGVLDSLHLVVSILEDKLILEGSVRGASQLDLALAALDADGRASRASAVGVGADLDRCSGDTHALVLREVDNHGSGFVRTGSVLVDGRDHLRGFLFSFGLNMVQRLEQPCEGVDAKIKQRTASKIEVNHAMGVGEAHDAVFVAFAK